jgi:hypothetical protein
MIKTAGQTLSAKDSHMFNSSNLGATSVNISNNSFGTMYFALLFFITVSFCEVLWKSSSNPVIQKIGYFAYPMAFFVFFLLSIVYIIRNKLFSLCTGSHLTRVLLYTFLLTLLFMYGLLRENTINLIIHDVILLYSLAIFLILGVEDRACHSMIKFLTIVFWAALVLSLLTFNIQGPSAELVPSEIKEGFKGRYVYGIAYGFFKPFIDLGLPLSIHGWLEKNRRWHYLQVLSLVGYLVINVVLFKFRHALALSALVVFASFVMKSSATRKLKIIFLILIMFIFAFSWLCTSNGILFMHRMKQFDNSEKVVDYRLPETEYYFKIMGNEWLWGRGLGGTFYGGRSFDLKHPIRIREGVHIGWVSFTLKGGLPLLIIMLTFFGAGLKINRQRQQREPYYTIARLWVPIFFLNWLVDPISFSAVNVPVYGLSFLLMARFGKKLVPNRRVF